MKNPYICLAHAHFPAGLRATFIGRNLIPSLALAFALPCAMTASADTVIYNTAGTTDWLCPPGVTSITVECWGGGGAGGGSFVNGGTASAGGGGGGGGAYARLDSVPVTPGNTYTVTIPAAATCPVSGFAHQDRYDGSPVSFTGDSMTVTANGGQGGQCSVVTGSSNISGQPGVGGAVGVEYDAVWAGGNATYWGAGNGGGGGGGAGDQGAGGSPAAANGSFGAGGTGSDADHAGGNGGAARNGAGNGNSAASPGGGGGGSKSTSTSTTSRAGGKGGLGRIILTYTIPPPPSQTKADNTDDLNLSSSWVGGTVPGPAEVGKWNNTVTSANTTVLGADLTWGGIVIEDPAGPVTIGGANTLTLGGAAFDLDMSAATVGLTLNCPIAMEAENIWNVANAQTLTIGGVVSGDFPLTMQGNGTVRLGAADVLPNGAGNGNITLNTTLDLNGNSETINGLSGAGTVDNASASTTSTLTVGENDQSGTFSGVLQNSGVSSTLNLIKTGAGTQVLGGANTLSGAVTITGGAIAVNNVAPFDSITGISMADGTMLRPVPADVVINAPISISGTGSSVTITGHSLPLSTGTTKFPFTLGGAISGDGDVIFAGVETTNDYSVINLDAASSYTGSTLVTTLNDVVSGPLNNGNIFFKIGANDALPTTTVLTLDGGDGGGSGWGRYCEFDLNGNNQTLAGLTSVSGRVSRVQRVVNSGATATLTVNNTNDHVYSAQLGWLNVPTAQYGSSANNDFALTKSGTGTLTLAGTSAYTGATGVTAGTLLINGDASAASGNVTVNANATLGGTGTIGGDTTIADTGKLTFDLSSDPGSHNKLDLATGKTLTFSGASTLTITSGGGATTGLYTLVTAPGGITGTAPATVILPEGWIADPPAITGVGNTDLVINITYVTGSGPLDHFAISAIGSPQTVGMPITGITITAQDASNNTVTGFTGTVTFGGTGGFSGTSASFTAGELTGVSVTPTVAGSDLTLTVDDGASHTGSTTITTIQSQFEAWSGGAAFDADANGDGIRNGLAWILGASGPGVSALDKLPAVSTGGGNLIFTFQRAQASINASTALSIEVGTTLASWPSVYMVGADTAGSSAGVTVAKDTPGAGTDTVTLTIPQSPDGSKFARLKAVQTP